MTFQALPGFKHNAKSHVLPNFLIDWLSVLVFKNRFNSPTECGTNVSYLDSYNSNGYILYKNSKLNPLEMVIAPLSGQK